MAEETLTLTEDFLLYPGLEVTTFTNEALTFVGHGIDAKVWNDYKKFKGEGVVMFLDGEPTKDGVSLLTKEGSASRWAKALNDKREIAQAKGAKA